MEFASDQIIDLPRRGCEDVGQSRNGGVGYRRDRSRSVRVGRETGRMVLLSECKGEMEVEIIVVR